MNDFDAWVNSLSNEIEGGRARREETRYPCGQCAGTGKWSGGTNRHGNSNCLACTGRGYFTTSPEFRAKARANAQAKKDAAAEALRLSIEEFGKQNPDMFADVLRAKTEFTKSLRDQLFRKGTLSVNQIAAWSRGWEKLQAIKAASNAKGGSVNLDRIREMFNAATESGYKRPVYRAEGLKISLASMSGRNAGCLYVVEIEDDAYQGKIDGTTFKAVREAKADVLSRLQIISADPGAAAVAYGRRTGTCSCCGRELTNHASIEAGIGPVCAQRWGF